MKTLSKLWRAGVAAVVLASPSAVLAQQTFGSQAVTDIGKNAGINSAKTPTQLIGSILNVFLGFLGIILLFYLLYGGYLWMTAAGDEGQVKKAKDVIKNAIIGLVVIIAAFAISTFVLGALVNATTQ
jgi:hypothetical protein